ncbi:MAG TPA: hypothetical protein VM492_00925, partial [Sumerlaeia bacterium]|nr:hypothetical protein [Sumerlaeia bacterium]
KVQIDILGRYGRLHDGTKEAAMFVRTKRRGERTYLLWRELGMDRVLTNLLAERKFGFDVERAVFLTVLHRLFDPGSDRAAEKWKERCAIRGALPF